jgi:hypothetical protein
LKTKAALDNNLEMNQNREKENLNSKIRIIILDWDEEVIQEVGQEAEVKVHRIMI